MAPPRLALGPGLQKFAQGDEGEDHTRRLKVQVHVVLGHQLPLLVNGQALGFQVQIVHLLGDVLAGEGRLQLPLLRVDGLHSRLVDLLLLLQLRQLLLQGLDVGLLLPLGGLVDLDLLLQLGVGAGEGVQLRLGVVQLLTALDAGALQLRRAPVILDPAVLDILLRLVQLPQGGIQRGFCVV